MSCPMDCNSVSKFSQCGASSPTMKNVAKTEESSNRLRSGCNACINRVEPPGDPFCSMSIVKEMLGEVIRLIDRGS